MMSGLQHIYIILTVLKGPHNSDLTMVESYFSPKFELVGNLGLFCSRVIQGSRFFPLTLLFFIIS